MGVARNGVTMDNLFDMVVKMVLAYQNWITISNALDSVKSHGTYKQVRSMSAKENRAYKKFSQSKDEIEAFSGIPYYELSKMIVSNANAHYTMVERVWWNVQDYIIYHDSELKVF